MWAQVCDTLRPIDNEDHLHQLLSLWRRAFWPRWWMCLGAVSCRSKMSFETSHMSCARASLAHPISTVTIYYSAAPRTRVFCLRRRKCLHEDCHNQVKKPKSNEHECHGSHVGVLHVDGHNRMEEPNCSKHRKDRTKMV